MAGSNLVGCKVKYCGVVWWWSESCTYLFKEYVLIVYRNIYNYLNRHICKGNFEKETMLTSSGRIDKCPTPVGFYDKFPTTRTDKMTNARQMPEGDGHVTSLCASEAEHVV